MTSTYNTGNPRCLPTIERLNELFYLQDESVLIRRGFANPPSPVGADGKQNTVHIDGDNFVIPRVIYKMQTGVEPVGVVRHLNDDASDIPYRQQISQEFGVKLSIGERDGNIPSFLDGISTTELIALIKRGRYND